MMFQKKMADAFDSARTFFTTACGRMHGSGQPEGISALENRLMQFCSRRPPLRIYADTCSLLCADGEAFLTAAERVLPQYQAQLLIFQSVLAELESVGQKTPAQQQNCQRVLARLQSLERAGVVRVCIGRSAGFSDPNFISDFVQDMLTSNVLLISQDNGLGTTAARLRDFLRPCIQTEYQIFSCRLNRGALEEVQDSGTAAQAPQKSPQPRRAPIPAAAPPDLKWPRRESGFSCTPYPKCNDVHFYPN